MGAVVSLKTTAPQAALFVNTDEMGQEEQLRRSRQVDQTVKTILEWLQGRYTRRATEDAGMCTLSLKYCGRLMVVFELWWDWMTT
uniref:Uncharacterized protein n=1 Tax=Timema monikensis TaxID=170555 RepID=A0A7R9EM26_9NEOP|nr:unnamed protein product [Timema monikensis]